MRTANDNITVEISDYEEIDFTQLADYGFTIDVPEQLWMIYDTDIEGYFTLENYASSLENFKVPKVLTAVSSSELEIKGKIMLRWIPYSREY